MLFDKETLLMDDDENSILHSTSTQIAKEADGHSRSQLIPDLTISPIHSSSGESTSALMISSISKASTPLKKSVVLKKTVLTKKKKNSNMKWHRYRLWTERTLSCSLPRTDLIQQLLGKIEDTGETAATAETKIFDLFQKQTQLQKESVDNEREFLLIFKSIMTNMASNGWSHPQPHSAPNIYQFDIYYDDFSHDFCSLFR